MNMDSLLQNKRSIKSIVKAALVINLLAESETPLPLSAIANKTQMAKSTLHGIVSTLVDVGFVKQIAENGYYQLDIRFFEIGSIISNKWIERQIADPYIQKIVEQTGETVHMAILKDGEALYIYKQESSKSIHMDTAVGVRTPAHCTGVGKILLSDLPKYEIKRIVKEKGLPKYTEFTITNFEILCIELNKIRKQGFAFDEQEFAKGLCCVSVPVLNHQGRVCAALSISGPVTRLPEKLIDSNKNILLSAAMEISKKLGYTYHS